MESGAEDSYAKGKKRAPKPESGKTALSIGAFPMCWSPYSVIAAPPVDNFLLQPSRELLWHYQPRSQPVSFRFMMQLQEVVRQA